MIILLLLFLPKVYLKTKKMTDISQTQAGFQGFLTHNPAVFVEIDDIFDCFRYPLRDI